MRPTWTAARLLGIFGSLVVVTAVLALFGNGYQVIVATNLMITLMLTLSLNLVIGNLGLLSFAHGAFFGTGAYVAAILAKSHGVSLWLALPPAMLGACVVAAVLGIPVLRLRGIFLAVATLAFSSFFEIFVRQATDITQGAYGIAAIPPLVLFGHELRGRGVLVLAGLLLALTLGLLVNLLHSPLGRAFAAVRDNEAAASASGIAAARTRLIGLLLSAACAGAAGWLYVAANLVLNPYVVGLELTFLWFFMILIGGPGSILGVVLGTVLLSIGPLVLGFASSQQILTSGVIMLVVVVFAPKGLSGLLARLAR